MILYSGFKNLPQLKAKYFVNACSQMWTVGSIRLVGIERKRGSRRRRRNNRYGDRRGRRRRRRRRRKEDNTRQGQAVFKWRWLPLLLLLLVACTEKRFYRLEREPWLQDDRHFFSSRGRASFLFPCYPPPPHTSKSCPLPTLVSSGGETASRKNRHLCTFSRTSPSFSTHLAGKYGDTR